MDSYVDKIALLIDSFIELSSATNTSLNLESSTSQELNIDYPSPSLPEPSEIEEPTESIPALEVPISNSEAPISNSDDRSDSTLAIYLESSDQILTNIYRLLNFSILSGEYISVANLKSDLDKIKEKLSEVLNSSDLFSEEIQKRSNELTVAINLGIEVYKIFLHEIENRFSDDSKEYLFSYHHNFKKEVDRQQLGDFYINLYNYFATNISLSSVDHFFSGDDSQFEDLYKIEHRINNVLLPQFDDLTKVIKYKIAFLQHKWKARKQQENPTSIYYNIDGQTKVLKEFDTRNEKISEWLQIINSQYELDIQWKHHLTQRVRSYKNKRIADLSFLQIHQLIKYYKDVEADLSKLEKIRDYLLSIPEDPAKCSYDKYTLNITRNYAINNTFSLIAENESIPVITGGYKSAKKMIIGDVINFFLDFKYLSRVIDLLLKQIESGDKLEFIKDHEKLVNEECKKTLDAYYQSKEWAKSHTNYIFLLPYSEATVEIIPIPLSPQSDIILSKVFYASTFVLPKINDKIEAGFVEIKSKYKSISLQVEIIKRFRNDLDKINEVSRNFDKRDMKSVEIISIFTAIITFVLSSIPAFKFVTTVWQAILFMVALSSSLGIFVLLILFSVSIRKKWLFGLINTIVLIGIAIGCYFALDDYEKSRHSIDKYSKTKIDSIVTVKVDSVWKLRPLKNPSLENPVSIPQGKP